MLKGSYVHESHTLLASFMQVKPGESPGCGGAQLHWMPRVTCSPDEKDFFIDSK
jgi:hypothetical protein